MVRTGELTKAAVAFAIGAIVAAIVVFIPAAAVTNEFTGKWVGLLEHSADCAAFALSALTGGVGLAPHVIGLDTRSFDE